MKQEKAALFMSGAAMKISFMAGAAINLIRKGTVFNTFVGISSGSILSFSLAVGKITETEDFMLKYTQKDVFKERPNSIKGMIMSFYRLITGKSYILDQSKLEETIKSVISQRDFDLWKDNPKSPDCYVGVVDMKNGEIKYFDLKNYTYDQSVKLVLASSSIPFFTKPVEMFNKVLVDGGNRDHIGSSNFLTDYNSKYDRIYSIFSRPFHENNFEKWKLPKSSKKGVILFWLWALVYVTPEIVPGEDFLSLILLGLCLKQVNIHKVLLRSIEIFNLETSLNDEKITDYICKEKGIEQVKIFAPYKLSSKTYDITPETSKKWYRMGIHESNLVFQI